MGGRFNSMNKRYEEHDLQSGLFLKFDDGDKFLIAFLGEPHIKEIYWEDQKTHPWTDGCGKPKTLKTSMNVAVLEKKGGAFSIIGVKILENSKTFYKLVAKMDAKYGVESKVFEIERTGAKKDTTYTILPEGDITDALRSQLEALELYDLTKSADDDGDAVEKKAGAKTPEPAAIITQADGSALIDRLKALKTTLGEAQGTQMMTDFTAMFGIKKIRDLPEKRLEEAQRWVTQEEEAARHAANDASGEPGDPFA